MPKERESRSKKYQYLLLETTFSSEMMSSFCNTDAIAHKLNPFHYDEEILDLEDELKEEFWKIVNTQLTKRQREVIKLHTENFTQMEIAKKLGVNQSSITKSLHGNVDYTAKKRVYGGSIRKIAKIIEEDEKIRKILDRINELREEKW